jgi:unspecific monooxygenase
LSGFLHAARTNALTIWTDEAFEKDIVVRRFMGRVNATVNAPEAIHRVLVENHANYRRSPASIRILRPIAGQGLLLSEGEPWRRQRRIVSPALGPRALPLLASHMVRVAQEHTADLMTRAGEPADLLAAMQRLALDVAGRSMFSLETSKISTPLRQLIASFAADLSRPHLLDMVLPPSIPTLRDLRRRLFQRRWMRFIESLIAKRLLAPETDQPRDLLDLLRAARDPETGVGFTRIQLRDQVATLILAGHETTAVTLFWALTLLAQDAAEQERCAEEAQVVALMPDQALDALPALPRIRAVLNETLRLYPPAFTIVREAIAPDRLSGIDIPPRSIVMIAPWVLHRHKRFWQDPDLFDPSRFMPGAPPPPRFAFLPFGTGPRVCVGAQFALTEAAIVLATLLPRLRVALQSPPPLPSAVVTTQPDHPPLFVLHRR